MPLPRIIAVSICTGVLGVQLAVAVPPASERSWYWPFLPYPMYSRSHARSDTLIVPQLRVRACGESTREEILDASTLGAPLHQLRSLLTMIVRAPNSDTANIARGRLARAIEAEFPARYCAASAWTRTVRVGDQSTYDLDNTMHLASEWELNRAGSK
jgi:hypothetical protein